MSWFDRLRNQSRDDDLAHNIDREMQFHLDERADDLVARGMSQQHAQDEARRRFGNVGMQKEQTRERNLFAWLDTLIADCRYAVRSLRAAPAFAIVAVVSLGLGIGANTAIFSLLNAVMLKSLPVQHPEQLVSIERDGTDELTNPLWEELRNRQDVFASAFAFGPTSFGLTMGGEKRNINANWVSGDFFSGLGVQPAVGRLFTRADDVRGCPATAVLDYGFWQSEYGGDPNITARMLALSGHQVPIVGVTDPRFFGVDVGHRPMAYMPLCAIAVMESPEGLTERHRWFLHIMGRLKPGVAVPALNARLAVLSPAIAEATLPEGARSDDDAAYRNAVFEATPAANGISSLRTTYKTALYDLMAIVALVLLVACANVANLLLARAAVRRREVAVRLALGASRARIARQLITESLLLSSLGTIVACALTIWGTPILVSLLSTKTKIIALDLHPDMQMFAFTAGIATLTGLLFGLVPAWQVSRVDPQSAMKARTRSVGDALGRLRLGRALVSSQIALSLVLVAAAALLVGSWRRLLTLDTGFRRSDVLLVGANIDPLHLSPEQNAVVFDQLIARLRAIPGVHAASGSNLTPVSGAGWNTQIHAEGFKPAKKRDDMAWVNGVTPGFFSTLGIRVLAGRDFDRQETPTAPKAAIVSEAMARKFLHTPNAVGMTFRTQLGRELSPPYLVVGVVANTKYRSLRDTAQPIVYLPRTQLPGERTIEIELYTSSPAAIAPAVRAAIAEADPQILFDISTLEGQLADSMPVMRATATLAGFFGLLAVMLAAIGLYGIMSYSVARRRNEIGVRIALGAGQGRVMRMVLGDVGRIVTIGVILGIALAVIATKLISSFIYDVQRNDPATLAGSALLLAIVGALAAALPAWRAARLDPVAMLRED
ncbi:MAG TPA: ABC transporter permease [Gemmatimonadaceae bacterium]|jgi:predicted permease